jgi:hypothetical protein
MERGKNVKRYGRKSCSGLDINQPEYMGGDENRSFHPKKNVHFGRKRSLIIGIPG